ncbi:hypothetical protein B0H16DRAFT_1731672 [Mycena metata]|uniref:F-box domain-containing protein n=1 Tax=Mycena metata TaxID=1033252 RepID=A0AAD7MW29_9AGAR|nr:hypothetical protein B0H16DRAFT_1731672 [Mycena metata]
MPTVVLCPSLLATISTIIVASSIERLPFELLSSIFELALGNYWELRDKGPYELDRSAFAAVCTVWRAVILRSPSLWNSLEASTDTPCRLVSTSLSLGRLLPLQLRLDLRRGSVFSPENTLHCFTHHFHRLQLLCVTASDAEIISTLAILIASHRVVTLRYISVICLGKHGDQFGILDLGCAVHSLRSLKLRRVRFNWTCPGVFAGLTTLVLRDMLLCWAPGWEFWHSLSIGAPKLARLCVRNMGCSSFPPSHQTIRFHSVTDLDLFYAIDCASLRQLVSAFVLPALARFYFIAPSTEYLADLFVGSDGADYLDTLALYIPDVDLDLLQHFFRWCPNLRFLDVRTSEREVLEAIGIREHMQRGYSVVCPALSVLAVADEHPKLVRQCMVACWPFSRAMDHVIFRGGFPEIDDYDEDLKWIQERVAVGIRLRYVHPPWVEDVFA